MPGYQSLVEPFTALFYVLAGAPDFKKATVSTGCWLFAIASIAYFVAATRRRTSLSIARAIDSLLFGAGVLLLFVLYLLFAVLTPFPSWTLSFSEPNSAIADLHSHTTASYDAFATADENVRLHRARGYNVVAWTEHYPSASAVTFQRTFHRDGMDVIGGFEIVAPVDGTNIHLIVLGAPESSAPCASVERCFSEKSLGEYVDLVHRSFHGAILVNNADLTPALVNRLADLGVDGFEIANQGHPTYSHAVQDAILSVQRTRGLNTVAVSDWHGWGGLIRTWTVFRGINSQQSEAEGIIDILRSRGTDRIVPVVAQPFDIPSFGRVLFAPFVELVRYGRELSLSRILSWWVWSVVLGGLFAGLRRRGYDPLGGGLLVAAGGLGIGLIVEGFPIISIGLASADHAVARDVGIAAMLSGTLAILYAVVNFRQARRPLLAVSPATQAGRMIAARFPALVVSLRALRNVTPVGVVVSGWRATGIGWVVYALVLSVIAAAVTATPPSTHHFWHEAIEIFGILLMFAGGGVYAWITRPNTWPRNGSASHADVASQFALEVPIVMVGLGAGAQSGSLVAAAAVAFLTWVTIQVCGRWGGSASPSNFADRREAAATYLPLSLPAPSLPTPSLPAPSLPAPSLPAPSLPAPSLPMPSPPIMLLVHNAPGAVIVIMALAMVPIAETIERLQASGILPILFHLD
jgi:hypothetical protein